MGEKKKKKTSNRFVTTAREFSAGGVVYKKLKSLPSTETLWLVTKSNPSKLYPKPFWRLPKGWLDERDNGLKPGPFASGLKKSTEDLLQNAAIREVEEEGGISAKIIKKIATERYFFTRAGGKKILKFVTFYLMQWQEDVPLGFGPETSEVGWFSHKDARKILSYSSEKKILDKAKELLTQGIQKNLV